MPEDSLESMQNLPQALLNEDGGGFGFVCIWRGSRQGDIGPLDYEWKGTVREFLQRPENQGGTWLIDGGWGGPPGPIHVRWNTRRGYWENGGYCGRLFE